MVFGDSDHDQKNEIIGFKSAPCRFEILERQPDNSYTLEYTGPCVHPFVMGDIDVDGLTDLVSQSGANIKVYESPTPNDYPTRLAWTSPPLTNVIGQSAIGDTDRDGKMEIIHSANQLGGREHTLHIFENTGDDSFEEVFVTLVVGNGTSGNKILGDWDGDGLLEFAMSGFWGWVHVFESPTDNVWALSWSGQAGLMNAYAITGGLDTDGNGKPEFFVLGDVIGQPTSLRRTVVYEATADDSFAAIDTFAVVETGSGGGTNAVADLESDGSFEYVIDVFTGLYAYRAQSVASWTQVGCLPSGAEQIAVNVCDLNANGTPEVVWVGTGSTSTKILEHQTVTSQPEFPPVNRLVFSPNPCRTATQIVIPADIATTAARLSVYDARGRLVERLSTGFGTNASYAWQPNQRSGGVYFVRLETASGTPLASGHVVVSR
jgi:hypothetical protein